ncbi:MAG: hypothetical protein ABFC94_03520 [Syntrophomonas sp.]
MRMKSSKKHVIMCLLLCSLFLTSYISFLNTNDIISSVANLSNASFESGASEHSLMVAETNSWHFDYVSATGTSILELFNFSSIKNTRPLVTKTIFDILTALIAAQIVCLIYSARLSKNICTQFNSIRIIFFLHKKDGMK